jgi:hypothetical protein
MTGNMSDLTRRTVLGAAVALPAVAMATDRSPLKLEGTPSDRLPEVLAVGRGDIQFALISMAARHPEGRDAEYLEWHSLDHRPEYHRLPEVRASLRLVSTPACRAARAAGEPPFDRVDHVMTYQFAGTPNPPGFSPLGAALSKGGRMSISLPSVARINARLAGKVAAPRAVAGADMMIWRPAIGVYVIVERSQATPEPLTEVPGVAGIWSYDGLPANGLNGVGHRGLQISYHYLDDDPLAVAARMREPLRRRWATGEVTPLLAAPFFTVVPFAWDRFLP